MQCCHTWDFWVKTGAGLGNHGLPATWTEHNQGGEGGIRRDRTPQISSALSPATKPMVYLPWLQSPLWNPSGTYHTATESESRGAWSISVSKLQSGSTHTWVWDPPRKTKCLVNIQTFVLDVTQQYALLGARYSALPLIWSFAFCSFRYS